MGLLTGLARLDPKYLFWDTARNIKDGGDIVDGIKRTVKEDLTEDNPLPPNRLLPYQTVSKRPSTQRFRK